MANQNRKQNLEKNLTSKSLNNNTSDQQTQEQSDPILCNHCLRTASNGIKCQGICVADSNY
ncbi:MAG: hypothetical protein NW214_05275 [Pseudanabaenaceae cyanobacterium bins.39]|nr:hypothetical protein [Pseudanabaenaceae cyanobacterium bins.39]